MAAVQGVRDFLEFSRRMVNCCGLRKRFHLNPISARRVVPFPNSGRRSRRSASRKSKGYDDNFQFIWGPNELRLLSYHKIWAERIGGR